MLIFTFQFQSHSYSTSLLRPGLQCILHSECNAEHNLSFTLSSLIAISLSLQNLFSSISSLFPQCRLVKCATAHAACRLFPCHILHQTTHYFVSPIDISDQIVIQNACARSAKIDKNRLMRLSFLRRPRQRPQTNTDFAFLAISCDYFRVGGSLVAIGSVQTWEGYIPNYRPPRYQISEVFELDLYDHYSKLHQIQ